MSTECYVLIWQVCYFRFSHGTTTYSLLTLLLFRNAEPGAARRAWEGPLLNSPGSLLSMSFLLSLSVTANASQKFQIRSLGLTTIKSLITSQFLILGNSAMGTSVNFTNDVYERITF